MQFRAARHTNQLEAITRFYTDVIGLEVLGSFQDHDGYNGVFLGHAGQAWHLEFTQSEEAAQHEADADDLLVFYPETEAEFERIRQQIDALKLPLLPSKNPYWQRHGLHIADPDGFGVVISPQRYKLT